MAIAEHVWNVLYLDSIRWFIYNRQHSSYSSHKVFCVDWHFQSEALYNRLLFIIAGHCTILTVKSYYSSYINLTSDSDEEWKYSPTPPPMSPFTPLQE